MDSLTQIVLGAAVGEAVLGKKIGNRAMIWGAVGGTIPDLDVMSNLFMGDLQAMCAHRGITHSIFFSVVAPLFFSWLLSYLYRSGAYRSTAYKAFISIINSAILVMIVFGVYRASDSIPALVLSASFAGYLLWRLYRFYLVQELEIVEVRFREWYLLFFLAFFTHIALDCFTAYGTQVFQPFSNLRVAFNTISVVDPLYTLPFIVFLSLAAFSRRGTRRRALLNWTGIAVSSAYLLFTVFNHAHINRVFSRALEHRNIEVDRQMVNPSILQNILWSCVAESDSAYYLALYSMLDSDPHMHVVNTLKKHPEVIAEIEETHEYQALDWFSNGYLQVVKQDSVYDVFDLRFAPMRDTVTYGDDFVFRFQLKPVEGGLEFSEVRESPDNMGEIWQEFVTRVKGY